VRRADNLTTFMCQLSRNSGASASRNPKGLSRSVAGNLYLCKVAFAVVYNVKGHVTAHRSLATSPGLHDSAFETHQGHKICLLSISLRMSVGSSQSTVKSAQGIFSPVVEQPEHEADH
jgi:hypothetical protein